MAWPTITIITTDMDAGTDNPGNARAQIYQIALNVNSIKDAYNAANGIAPLDASSLVPTANLPVISAAKGGTGQTTFTIGDILYASSTSALSRLGAGTAGNMLVSNGPGTAPSWQTAAVFPSTTRMPFNQTAAPTGWTKDTTFNDSIMRIVSGSVSNGGSLAFSTFNAQTATSAYTLTTADIPAHTHTYSSTSGSNSNPGGIGSFGSSSSNTGSIGGGGAHSHGLTHGIKYNDFIIASKD
jgi:uncharacterized membrane protein YgcG